MLATVVIPFHRNLCQLGQSLAAARQSMPSAEILIAADGAVDDCRPLAQAHRARVIDVPGPSGPAVARNRAAAQASGDVLLFVDTDVVPAPDALPGMCRLLEEEPGVAGVFGAYDLAPPEHGFMSQYKNLSHAYVHERGNGRASTFWAGLGAIRTTVFHDVKGFDERFRRPSVEDIELGYRVTSAGYALRLDPRFRGTHLKRWTFRNSIATDIWARGVPWTQLIHQFQALQNDLNTSHSARLSVVLTAGLLASLGLAVITPWAWLLSSAMLAGIIGLNIEYYRWFAAQRGLVFALKVVPANVLYHACNGLSFVIGTLLYLVARLGWRLPGSLPLTGRGRVTLRPAKEQNGLGHV